MTVEQFSSFQIGKLLSVSRQAVNQWIDKGYMASYRTPGGHRRVRRNDLMDFLRERNIPVPEPLLRKRSPGHDSAAVRHRIMIVDDDEDFLELMKHAFLDQMSDIEVSLFDNGFDALVAIGSQLPDMLVLDLKMPKMDGVEVCRHLKQNPLTASLPIVVVTVHRVQQWEDHLKALNVHQIFSKTTPLLEIVDQICAQLSSSSMRAAASG